MKLHCNVEIHYRTVADYLPVVYPTLKKKSHRSILTFCRKSSENNDLYLLLQTRENKQGTKYKIIGNVTQVFTKFINKGKATIRLQQPSHDLIIQSDVVPLKNFLCALDHIMKGHSQDIDSFLTTVNSKDFIKQQVKIVIKKKSEYPTLEGFPLITEELFLVGLGRKSFDRQILRLQNLRILDLSDNRISSLPKELGTLPHLQHLIVSQNQFGKSPGFKWTWLESASIKNNLLILDISDNSLTELPIQIGQLNALIQLKACQNMFTRLPHNIGTLSNLEYLDVSRNNLLCLPGNIKNLRLRYLNVSQNAFMNIDNHRNIVIRLGMPSLTQWSARYVLRSRLPYDASLIPFTLVKLLNNAKYCTTCRTACFSSYVHMFMQPIGQIASDVIMTHTNSLILEYYYCSLRCSSLITSL